MSGPCPRCGESFLCERHAKPNTDNFCTRVEADSGTVPPAPLPAESAGSPAGTDDRKASPSAAANSARTLTCPSCAVLSRQYGALIEQNAALAARLRERDEWIAARVAGERRVDGLAELARVEAGE